MNNSKAAEVVRLRLKYDWIVLLCGLVCALIQFIYQGDLATFLMVVIVFGWVEIFEAPVYRSLKNGGEGYHALATKIMDQDTNFGYLLVAVFLEFVVLLSVSCIFLVKIFI